MERDAWLPNLTAGVSIWSLASDLNRAALFDGRLLVPRLEGPANLPRGVEWNVTGLVPLAEAKRTHSAEVEHAIAEFAERVERALALFEQEGFARHRAAFTLPSLEGPHYFFGPHDGKLYATNWGASPRSIAQRAEHVIDALRFTQLVRPAPVQVLRSRTPLAVVSKEERAVPLESGSKIRWLIPILLVVIAALAVLVFVHDEDEIDAAPPEPRPPRIASPEPPHRVEPSRPPPLPAPHQRIYFALGDHELTSDQRESLEAIGAYLRDHREVRTLLIEGHADVRGREPDNLSLSAERALRVRAWLEANGIEGSRLACAACSELHPQDGAPGNEGLRANRRVEFFVVDPALAPAPHGGCGPCRDSD